MTYPNILASGANSIASSPLFTGATNYITLGTPSALTSVLLPTHEFTILVRTNRTAYNSTGTIIAQGDSSNTTFSINSQGGSSVSCVIGGTTFNTGTGSISEPTWNTIALVNRNASGTYMARCVLGAAAGTSEVASGSQVCTKDIMVGATRHSSNTDSASFYSGHVATIAIYNYAMTDDQAHTAMGWLTPQDMLGPSSWNGLTSNTGLVAFYPMNETSGTVLNDCVAGNNGTATSSSLWDGTSQASYPSWPVVTIGDSLTSGSGSQTGTPYGNQVTTGGSGISNGRIRAIYGAYWLDWKFASQALNNIPGNNDDFQLRTPTNICADNTHLIDAGYVPQSQAADVRMRALGF
jgi:hypothetical protein